MPGAKKRHPGQLLLEEIFIHRNVLTKQHAQYDNICPTTVVTNKQIPVFLLNPSSPRTSHCRCGFRCSNTARPSHQQYIIKSQKRETFRQMTGTGSNSFTIPAMMIGTEQKIVTKMVNTILSKRVIAASILVIMNLFKRLAIDSALKKRKAQILAENDPNNG